MLIYKIMTQEQWQGFERDGRFKGAPVDLADGYIHFSTSQQMAETAARHFANAEDLMLVWAQDNVFGADLRWEVSRGGARFPHLYRVWQISEVTGKTALPLVDGTHRFPEPV